MVPFQKAYLMICKFNCQKTDMIDTYSLAVAMMFVILAGNHGLVSVVATDSHFTF